MTDVEKVAAIYDWIVNEVDYDYAVASLGTGSGTSGYNAFYLEGVFDDKRAVCDGKSKAFALLCGMEHQSNQSQRLCEQKYRRRARFRKSEIRTCLEQGAC